MTRHTSGDWIFEVNHQPAAFSVEMTVQLVEVLIAAGWTQIASSDATTVANTTLSVSDWSNTNAWVHLRDPGGFRDLSWQQSGQQQARAYLTKRGDPMLTGAATVSPLPAGGTGDLMLLVGNTFNYTVIYNNTAISNQCHIGAATLPSAETGDFYPFYIVVRTKGSGGSQGFAFAAPLLTPADGSVGDADSEPWGTTRVSSSSQWSAWFKAGLTGETAVFNGLAANIETNMDGQNPYSLAFDLQPILVYDTTGGLEQRKGMVEMGVATFEGITAHATYDTYNVATEGEAKCLFDQTALRWPHGVTPVF